MSGIGDAGAPGDGDDDVAHAEVESNPSPNNTDMSKPAGGAPRQGGNESTFTESSFCESEG